MLCYTAFSTDIIFTLLHVLSDYRDDVHRLFRSTQMQKLGKQTPNQPQLHFVGALQRLKRHLIFDVDLIVCRLYTGDTCADYCCGCYWSHLVNLSYCWWHTHLLELLSDVPIQAAASSHSWRPWFSALSTLQSYTQHGQQLPPTLLSRGDVWSGRSGHQTDSAFNCLVTLGGNLTIRLSVQFKMGYIE